MMIEILGNGLEIAMKKFNIKAIKTYQSNNDNTDFKQVWELTEAEYQKLCNISESEWTEDCGWWRHSDGSNLGDVNHRYKIKGHYIKAWDSYERCDMPREYPNLLEYFCGEIGVSNLKNVTALSIDLAAQNGMRVSELFSKYQDENVLKEGAK